jgi:hypothetical protein
MHSRGRAEEQRFSNWIGRFRRRHEERVAKWSLGVVLVLLLAGSLIPPLGEWIESLQFAGPALLLIVALVILDAISKDRSISESVELVLPRSSALLPFFREAENRKDFRLTFCGYSGETLYGLLSEFMADLEAGRGRVSTIEIRLLLPDCNRPMAIPCSVEGLDDFPPYRELAATRSVEYVRKIRNAVSRMVESGAVESGNVEVRYHRMTPMLKAYVINDDLAFWGPYVIEESAYFEEDGSQTPVLDLKGTRTPLLGADASQGLQSAETVRAISSWVESVWSLAAQPGGTPK